MFLEVITKNAVAHQFFPDLAAMVLTYRTEHAEADGSEILVHAFVDDVD